MPLRLFDDDFRLEVSSRDLEAFADEVEGRCGTASHCRGEPSNGMATGTVVEKRETGLLCSCSYKYQASGGRRWR